MADDEIETVDLDEVARLERAIAEREATEKLQPPVRLPVDDSGKAGSSPARLARPENPAGSGERGVAPPRADLPLQPFISAEAVDQRLQAISAHLQQIEAQTRHTMLLVMILAERMNLTEKEYERAMALAQRSEQAAKGQH